MSGTDHHVRYLRIGQLARRSGVSAKALRLYEQRGLLQPCTHSAAGYRLYGPPALQRLTQIVLLKRSGFSLAEIGRLLRRDPHAAASLLFDRIDALERDLADKRQALLRLRAVARRLGSASSLDIDELLQNLNMSQDIEFTPEERSALQRRAEKMGAHFTEEEREGFRRRAEALGEAGMAEAQRAWPALIVEVAAAMDACVPATDPQVLERARRWYALVQAATGGEPEVARKLGEAYRREPELMAEQGMDPAMFDYIRQAMTASGLKL